MEVWMSLFGSRKVSYPQYFLFMVMALFWLANDVELGGGKGKDLVIRIT